MRSADETIVPGLHKEWVVVISEGKNAPIRSFAAFKAALEEGTQRLQEDFDERAIYVLTDLRGTILAACAFVLGVDDDGRLPTQLTLPVRDLARRGDSGADLGAGPIRIACAGHCPIPWHGKRLWGDIHAEVAPYLATIQHLLRGRAQRRRDDLPERRVTRLGRRATDSTWTHERVQGLVVAHQREVKKLRDENDVLRRRVLLLERRIS